MNVLGVSRLVSVLVICLFSFATHPQECKAQVLVHPVERTVRLPNPFYEPSDAEFGSDLCGAFELKFTADTKLSAPIVFHIGRAGNEFPKSYEISIVYHKNSTFKIYHALAYATKQGESVIVHLADHSRRQFRSWEEVRPDRYPYHIYRITKSDDGFSVAELNEQYLLTAVKKSKLKGKVTKATFKGQTKWEDATVTETQLGLKQFIINADLDELFDKPVAVLEPIK